MGIGENWWEIRRTPKNEIPTFFLSVRTGLPLFAIKRWADPSYPLITEEGSAYVPPKGWAEIIPKVCEWIRFFVLHVEAG